MPNYSDIIDLVRTPQRPRVLPAIWDFFPCHAAAVGGVPNFTRYYFDVDEKLRIQRTFKSLIPEAVILPGVFPDLGVVVTASAFGGSIRWFDQGAPFIGETIRSPEDIDSLSLPEPGLAGLTPLWLVQRDILRRKLEAQGIELERWAMSMGPAEIAGLLMGYDKLYYAFYDEPERLARLMDLVTDFIIAWLEVQSEAMDGAHLLCIADHMFSQVPPELSRQFTLPCLQRIFTAFPNALKLYHNEGHHADEHVSMVLDFGADIWHFGSDVHQLDELLPRLDNRVVLFGGLNPHGVMRHGTPDDVRKATSKALEVACGHRMLFSTGTGTTPEATLANQRAMVETVLERDG
ncbi:MAG: hypothetical protein HN742_24835 [Lentisphaerae bacterium]|jgi:uroporphyrinogen decarboxylase|nr:hypothetical protein [Lentisphaerota bacterium]MBT4815058.1 hypothetical protein [Lentisphaerota bacterium]MBT5608751.1 hypothetical protein [Lentisphaerota bacterium]MBT7054088.1 hypothetical protein [Lentisphaerota bacterium]MBT7845127.1 hypothetical protein [Lentisphaerota bacterium]